MPQKLDIIKTGDRKNLQQELSQGDCHLLEKAGTQIVDQEKKG